MEKLVNWLRLARSENVTNNIFWNLLQRYHSVERALEYLPYLAQQGNSNIKIASKAMVERELEEASKYDVKYFYAHQKAYPSILKHIAYPPPVISIIGDSNIFKKPAIAIVGSRKASNTGMQLASSFAAELGQAGFSIVSGLAVGIDSAAHKASVTTGTIAVLAGGVNYIYPEQNRRLYYEIIDNNGVIISEKAFNYTPKATDFPKRNKIIAGLALAMLVIEATLRSGSMISARLANEYNKLVFALPHSLLNEKAQGNNSLLREGAIIALTAQDIIETISPLCSNISTRSLMEAPLYNTTTDITNIHINDEICKAILKTINFIPTNIKTIQKLTSLPLEEIEKALLELQLTGKIHRYANNNIALKH